MQKEKIFMGKEKAESKVRQERQKVGAGWSVGKGKGQRKER